MAMDRADAPPRTVAMMPHPSPEHRRTRSSRVETLVKYARHHGFPSTLLLLVLHPLQRFGVLRLGGVYRSSTAHTGPGPVATSQLEVRFLEEREINELAAGGTGWFFPGAVARSLARGERCIAVIRDGSVVHSRWIAPGPLRQMGVDLEVPPNTLFVQRTFTHPEARGTGLAAHAQWFAKVQLQREGIDWTIGIIDAVNAASIAMSRKGGATRVGWIVQIGPDSWGLSHLVRTSPHCPTASTR